MRIPLRGHKEMPARLYCLFQFLVTDSGGLCHLLEVGKAVFLFHCHFGINVGVLKPRTMYLCADDLLLHIGGCLFQLCTGCHLLETVKHDGPRHRLLSRELLLHLL